MGKGLSVLGGLLARFLDKKTHQHGFISVHSAEQLLAALQPGDVLLVEGDRRVSSAIKYLTQSTWSHAALFIGIEHGYALPSQHCLIESDTQAGVRTVGIDEFHGLNTRICRPVGLTTEDCQHVIDHAMAQLGHQYDLRNVWDLARYLIATPPVPNAYRRRMIALGSGDPSRAICSTLIAQAFQAVRYPILPIIEQHPDDSPLCPGCVKEVMHIQHHSLFAPRDFDISPYFQVIKVGLDNGFDYQSLHWAGASE
ncbi:MAG: YiiX/YebB-like N1pC/P60 family cysteine hydrolase [Pseudomonas sp.]|nr:YiiX/YebB-like N1pC/P60 family cysteine hydrolase [Pseudomonas sp.]